MEPQDQPNPGSNASDSDRAAEPPPPQAGGAGLDRDARMWGMFCHLAALIGYTGVGSGWGQIVGPLVVWLIQREKYPFVEDQGKEALNFQITMMIAAVVAIPLVFVGIGIVLLLAVGIVDLVFVILAAVSANKGVAYRYPLSIRFIK